MSAAPGPRPEFLTNRDEESVAASLNAHLAHLRTTLIDPYELAIASAYFNVGGYQLLADELDHPRRVRLLLGAEPDAALRMRRLDEPASPARARAVQLRRALEGHDRDLAQARDLLGFNFEADRSARRLVEWLRSDHVEVRRLADRFLHGKAYVTITDHDEGVVAGSSNFTYAGLAKNIELNLGHYQPSVVTEVRTWFDELWDAAEPFDLAALYEARFDAHPPQLIYLRMLWERYGAEVEAEAEATTGGAIHLTTFQRDGLWRAKRILAARRGVLIADEVGLGKTFLAGKLIEEAAIERRQRVLVVAPATLRDGPWRRFASDFNLPIELRSFEDLISDRRLNPDASGYTLDQDPDDYALVVIDEAHNVRNPATLRAEALRRLLAGRYRKDLVLVTATPVNNSLWDLYYLLVLFLRTDAVFADVGIPSMRDHFARAMALNPDDLSPEYLFDVLDDVAVRRTRPFVKRFYPTDTVRIDGRDVPITFPTPRVHKVAYDLDAVLPGFFDRFAAALDADDATAPDPDRRPHVLTLARYAPSRYGPGGVEAREVQLAGLLRSGLLKRFESSPYAFARTCETMAESHEAFLKLLDAGKVATGAALRQWAATDSDDPDEIDEYLRDFDELDDAAGYDVDLLRAHAEHDCELLRTFAAEADTVTRDEDPTLAALVEELAAIAGQADAEGIGETDVRDKRKVLVFTYYADTVDWIEEHLHDAVNRDPRLAAYRGRITSLTGSDGDKRDVLWGFAPLTTDAPEPDDRYDIVVTTDVLAEGVNLQQARHIINYDLPWNPMRLVQRHGRIDRIGSHHTEVFIRCVFPDRRLDDLLGLEERLHRKIKQAAAAVGVNEILPGSATSDVTFAETREEIERLRAEDPNIFEFGGVGRSALSGEEYRQELRKALDNPEVARSIKNLPWGSGSGMAVTSEQVATPGYVFCVRIANHPFSQFRYVNLGADDGPVVMDDTLTCLARARPPEEWDTPRDLDDETYRTAFDAWEIARINIVERWNHLADPANLAPVVPAVMRRAAQTVRDHAIGIEIEVIDRAVEAVEAPYAERILRLFRDAMAVDAPEERATLIIQLVDELGLEPPPPPEPLPEVNPGDVHLICWLAIIPRSDVVTA